MLGPAAFLMNEGARRVIRIHMARDGAPRRAEPTRLNNHGYLELAPNYWPPAELALGQLTDTGA